MKKIMTVSVIFAMLLSMTACEKTEEKPIAETTTAITTKEVTTTAETTAVTTEEVTTTPEETTTTAEETTVATAETNVAVTTAETTVAETTTVATTAEKKGPKTERTDDEKNGVYYIKEYDDKGREIAAYGYRMKDDSLIAYYTKKYDSNNGYEMKVYDGDKKLVSHEFRDAKDNIVRMNILSTNEYALYKRNDNGRLIKEEYYNENGGLTGYWTYTPDENSKTVKAEYYDVAGVFTYYYSGTINERGQYILNKKHSADGTIIQELAPGEQFTY